MRIAIVHGSYSGRTPSGENVVVKMQVEALKRAGHSVKLVGVNTDDLATSRTYAYRTALGVATGQGVDPTGDLLKFAPDIVHVHNLFPNFGTSWLRRWNGPVVATIHNFRPVCAAGILFRDGKDCTLCPDRGQSHAVIHKCYRGSALATLPIAIRNARGGARNDPLLSRVDATVFLSPRSLERFRTFGFDGENNFIVPNFVSGEQQGYVEAPSGRWIYMGRLSPEKGIEKLLEVWPSSVGLDIYGDGPDADAVAKRCHGEIRYHGSVPRTHVLSELAKARGLVLPSVWAEGMPTVYLEALSAGVPVLAKTGNSAADDVITSACGEVFDDWAEVPTAIENIEARWSGFSDRGHARFVEAFSEATWVASIAAVYSVAQNAYQARL